MRTIGFLFGMYLSVAALAQKKQIVFVCEHGSAKSVIAATYFNKLAKEKNIQWEAIARGTDPDAEVSPKTKKLLSSEGLLDASIVPQKIAQADVDAAQKIILFFPLPETINGRRKVSNLLEVQAVNEDFQKLRDDIVSKIMPMIDSLAKQKR